MDKNTKESYIDSEIYRQLKNLIEKGFKHNDLTYTDVKFHHTVDGGEADIVVFGEKNGKPVKLVIEAKSRKAKYCEKIDPYSVAVIGQALGYAKALDAQFIATTNGDVLILLDVYKRGTILETQIGETYKVKNNEEFFKRFLSDLSDYLSGTVKLLPLGDAFVNRLKYFHELLIPQSFKALKEKLEKDSKFHSDYKAWLEEQGFKFKNETHENVSKQFAYLLMNRILFYKTLEIRRKDLNLTPIKSQEPEEFDPDIFIKNIKSSFGKIVDTVDYEAVFRYAKILDDIPIRPALAEYLNDFVRDVEQYNLSEIKRDVIGHVYERMIPIDERKKLGQYYTPPLICDLIAKMCINSTEARVLDPACGSGGFLISAYSRLLELMNKKESDEKSHKYILNHICGVDINQFAAHLSVINLSVRNMDAHTDFVNVIASDFFKVPAGQATLAAHKRLSMREAGEVYSLPPNFDAVIANPPYTRQDDIGDKNYIDLIRKISLNFNGKQIDFSSEAGIYAYFFTHSTHFLKERGMMGYIVSNSWMDVKFGEDLQKFFLDNYKIKCIIDFDKRSFEEAAVNTVIIVLQKLTGKAWKKERDDNTVKFVRIKKHLSANEIVHLIEKAKESYEDNVARFVLINQKNLNEDYKWGKYLKAPEIYFKIIKNKKVLKLKEIAKVGVGTVTLANDFFIIPKEKAEQLGIESKFLKPAIEPREIKFLDVKKSDTNKYMLIVNEPKNALEGTNVLKYITYGETKDIEITRGSTKGKIVKGYQNLPALSTRKRWYSLGELEPGEIILPRIIWQRWYAALNKDKVYFPHTLYSCYPNIKENLIALLGILNSSLTMLFTEIGGQTMLGEGALGLMKHNFDELPIVNPNVLPKDEKERIEQSFLKLCDAQRRGDTTLEEKTRKELDEAVFDSLKLSEKDKNQIYACLKELRELRKSKKEVKVLIEE
jgi:type I restriction-modification system DNA methylase subunit